MISRKTGRFPRLATALLAPLLLALLIHSFAIQHASMDAVCAQLAGELPGIARELLAGSTEGRQALFGSCWHGPLSVLFYLPFFALCPSVWGTLLAGGVAWFFLLWSTREATKATFGGVGIFLAQLCVGGIALFFSHFAPLGIADLLICGLILLFVGALVDWIQFRKIRYVVQAGMFSAALLLCGAPFFLFVALSLVSIPLIACGERESARRMQAWILLGWLPSLYALGVWILLNKLMLNDGFYFLRSLRLLPETLHLSRWMAFTSLFWGVAVGMVWIFRRSLFSLFSLMLVVALTLRGMGDLGGTFAKHAFSGVDCAVLLVLFFAFCRCKGTFLRFLFLVGLVLCGLFPSSPYSKQDQDPNTAVVKEVESYVAKKSAYGRVFVLGYEGLSLLEATGGRSRMTQPNFDLHLDDLRLNYRGQHLFILCPKSDGLATLENFQWRYPALYDNGSERLLFDQQFAHGWRLFEMVTAPTKEQWESWK